MNIVIADVHFLLSCKDMPLVREPYRKTYAPFITDTISSGEGSVSIDVNFEIDEFPAIDQLTKIFEASDSWSMLKRGDEYLWADIPISSGSEPTCLACFHRRPVRVSIYCREALLTEVNGKKMLMNPFSYPLDQLLLVYALAEREGAFLHASAIEFNGRGYIFPGKSGAGKSTISQIFKGEGYDLLSDDRVVVRKIEDNFYAFGTPWAGDAEIAENKKLHLGGILFIRQSSEDHIEKITPTEAVERLMPVTSIPWFDEQAMSSILSFCEDLVLHIPSYDIFFTPDIGVVELFEKFVSE